MLCPICEKENRYYALSSKDFATIYRGDAEGYTKLKENIQVKF